MLVVRGEGALAMRPHFHFAKTDIRTKSGLFGAKLSIWIVPSQGQMRIIDRNSDLKHFRVFYLDDTTGVCACELLGCLWERSFYTDWRMHFAARNAREGIHEFEAAITASAMPQPTIVSDRESREDRIFRALSDET